MAINHIYKIEKGYEKGVLGKYFHNSKLQNCTMVGDVSGAMRAREFNVRGKPRVKILEFKKGTYIKSEAEMRHINLLKVKNVGD